MLYFIKKYKIVYKIINPVACTLNFYDRNDCVQ